MIEDDDTPPPTALAAEIHARFEKKMAPGGEIDKILNGHEPLVKRPPLSDAEIEVMKRSIEAQLNEYAIAINEAGAWSRKRSEGKRAKGFRCVQETQEGG